MRAVFLAGLLAGLASASRNVFSASSAVLAADEPSYYVGIPQQHAEGLRLDVHMQTATEVMAFVGETQKAALERNRVPFRVERVAEAGVPASYPSLDVIISTINSLASSYPSIARVVDPMTLGGLPGRTYENRAFPMLKISRDPSKELGLPNIHLVASHHARELIPVVIALDTAKKLVQGYATNATIREVVDSHEIFVSPVWNPDGYEYVFKTNAMWRKNRKPVASNAFGTDQNRNYPEGYSGTCPGSTSPSSETYKGPTPGSEEETRTMMSFSAARNFAKVLDLHSSGREVLLGFKCQKLNAELEAFLAAEGASLAKLANYGTRDPSADGEHQEWILKHVTSYAFLVETSTSFQPPYAEALSEAERVWPLLFRILSKKSEVSGIVRDRTTRAAIKGARLHVRGQADVERFSGMFGRFDLFGVGAPCAPNVRRTVDVVVSAPGYANATVSLDVDCEGRGGAMAEVLLAKN